MPKMPKVFVIRSNTVPKKGKFWGKCTRHFFNSFSTDFFATRQTILRQKPDRQFQRHRRGVVWLAWKTKLKRPFCILHPWSWHVEDNYLKEEKKTKNKTKRQDRHRKKEHTHNHDIQRYTQMSATHFSFPFCTGFVPAFLAPSTSSPPQS